MTRIVTSTYRYKRPPRAWTARWIAARLLHEAREAVPPTIFFFVGFNFIVLTTNLLVAKYLVATPETLRVTADLINKYPDRFLFGSDEVAPKSQESYLKVYHMYDPLWQLLTPEASAKVRKGNYERLFDGARHRVRAWEQAQGYQSASASSN